MVQRVTVLELIHFQNLEEVILTLARRWYQDQD